MFFHIYTLAALYEPAAFASKMKVVDNFIFTFFEWALAVPVIFHALNGTRLILYEAFRIRKDAIMIRWVFVLSTVYVLTLAVFMLMGNQEVSPGFFWFSAEPWWVSPQASWVWEVDSLLSPFSSTCWVSPP